MIEVFKTNVKCPLIAQQIIADVLATFITVEVSFDLEDEDCILRLAFEETFDNLTEKVYEIFNNNSCEVEILISDCSCGSLHYLSPLVNNSKGINAFLSIF